MAEPVSVTSLRSARRFDWKNLGLRAASAAVLVPAVVGAIFVGWLFLVMIAVSVALLAIEWAAMTAPGSIVRLATTVTVVVLIALFFAYRDQFELAWAAAAIGALLAALVARGITERAYDAALGVLYIAAPCVALTWLRAMPNPIFWTVLLFAVTWSTDICAYFVGTWMEGPKLWPRLSPNKTWSGLAGGLLGAMGAAMATAYFPTIKLSFLGHISTAKVTLPVAAAIGLAAGVATVAGDLWESALKRRYGVKDTGDLIPGHGGLLDRVDGLMFSVLAIAGARLLYHPGWSL